MIHNKITKNAYSRMRERLGSNQKERIGTSKEGKWMKEMNDYEVFIEKYIPSADVRKNIHETRHHFTDWECATIIWNSKTPLMNRHDEIRKIAAETSDDSLRKQIKERISYDLDALNLFEDNS